VSDVLDLVSLGVLGAFVPRDQVDQAISVAGVSAKRSGGKLPPWAVFYFTMLMALYPHDDYEELAAHVAPLVTWGRDKIDLPASAGGVSQARQRLGYEPLKQVFEQVCVPVADSVTRGAFLGFRRLMAIDGFETEVPDTPENRERFGASGGDEGSGYPKVRVVGIAECATRAVVSAAIGPVVGKGTGERSLAGGLYYGLEPDMLLMADCGFYSWGAWAQASATGADLLWRVSEPLGLPLIRWMGDESYVSLLTNPDLPKGRRQGLVAAARGGADIDPDQGRLVRVIEYDVPDRGEEGQDELIVLITTITDPQEASASELAEAYHRRWDVETAFDRIKTHLRPPSKVLRSKSPDLVIAEIYGMLLTGWALAKVICDAATEMDTTPGRVKYKRTIRIVRRHATREVAFSP